MKRGFIEGKTLTYLALLLALAAPGLGQGEDEPYFSLRSSRTFGSNSRPNVELTATNVDSLDFRVYRVNDPITFFQQLEDPHQFGGRVPLPSHEPTLLERIHTWKASLRADIRRSLRAQFTESPAAHFASLLHGSNAAANQAHYPESPVLNPRQLVLSFTQPVHSQTRWQSQSVSLDIKDRGVYLVEAVNKDLRAYTILMVSDIAMVSKSAQGEVTNLLVDRASCRNRELGH